METTWLIRNGTGRKWHIATTYDPNAGNNDDPVGDRGVCGRVEPADRFPHVIEPSSVRVESICGDCTRRRSATLRAAELAQDRNRRLHNERVRSEEEALRCPHHETMVLRVASRQTGEQRWCGAWYDCADRRCRYSVLHPSAALIAQLEGAS